VNEVSEAISWVPAGVKFFRLPAPGLISPRDKRSTYPQALWRFPSLFKRGARGEFRILCLDFYTKVIHCGLNLKIAY